MPSQVFAAERIQEACCLLLSREPWYGHATTFFDWIPSTRVETMGVRLGYGAVIECFYDADFVSALSIQELCTVIQHEIEHVVRCHCTRAASREPKIWNIAADMAVNGHKRHPHIGYRGEDGALAIPFRDELVWVPEYWDPTLSAESYYEALERRAPCLPTGMLLDDHSLWTESDVSEADAADIACHVAMHAAEKCCGTMPGHIERRLADVRKSETPWHVLLARFVGQHTRGRRRTYSRRNRRKDFFGMPGYKRRAHPHVSVIVDVSGSISPAELSLFFGEVERICAHARLDVLLWDSDFQGFHPHYRQGDWKKIKMTGAGGTDMAAPVRWLIENRHVSDCVIIFTDGWCPWPEPQRFPIMAALAYRFQPAPSWMPTVILPECHRSGLPDPYMTSHMT